jgi:LmbE family N-acetylglucosaminyl deacetylase
MKKSLLAILAHPDDESFGPGGTLAKYAREGVDVHVAIATDGAAGTAAEGFEDKQNTIADHRSQELVRATDILGVTLHSLGYRDSGMTGDPNNEHPLAFINAEFYEAVGKVVKLIRDICPQVVLTHDETGGYFHPDHIQCWKITTTAFQAAGDPEQYPELGAPFQPERLYFSAFPNRLIKVFVFFMRLRRQDPTKVGRNKDIDITRLGIDPKKIHTRIDYRDYWDIKRAASAEHGSQGGGGGFTRFVPTFLQKRVFGKETFMRAYPPVPDGYREDDFFAGISE